MAVKPENKNSNDNIWLWIGNNLNALVAGVLIVIVLSSTVASVVYNGGYDSDWWAGFWQNFSTEMMGAVITFALFELIINRVEKAKEEYSFEARQKRRLQILAGSRNNTVAVGALDELRAEGWLEEILQDKETKIIGANWDNTHLQNLQLPGKGMSDMQLVNAKLNQANMAGVTLRNANIAYASLFRANVSEADFGRANVAYASLFRANVSGADLSFVNLEYANVSWANLQQVQFSEANLRGVEFQETRFSSETTLPDGTNYDSEKSIEQMERFTNPDHPDFWQPDWVKQWDETGEPPYWLTQWYQDKG